MSAWSCVSSTIWYISASLFTSTSMFKFLNICCISSRSSALEPSLSKILKIRFIFNSSTNSSGNKMYYFFRSLFFLYLVRSQLTVSLLWSFVRLFLEIKRASLSKFPKSGSSASSSLLRFNYYFKFSLNCYKFSILAVKVINFFFLLFFFLYIYYFSNFF